MAFPNAIYAALLRAGRRGPATPASPHLLWARFTRRWGSSEAADQGADAPPETYVQVALPR